MGYSSRLEDSTVKQILRAIAIRNGVTKMLHSDNSPELFDEILCSFFEEIGCLPYKIPPFNINRMRLHDADVEDGIEGISTSRDTTNSYIPKISLSYKTTLYKVRMKLPLHCWQEKLDHI